MKIEYGIKMFDELNAAELYQLLKLRSEVFVVEQQCVYQDLDGKDLDSYHVMCFVDDELVGYTRILPPGISYNEASIGRVVISPNFRGLKLGRQLMENSIRSCKDIFETLAIRISAQTHLTKFYNSLGFIETGEPYIEDGIPHIEMITI